MEVGVGSKLKRMMWWASMLRVIRSIYREPRTWRTPTLPLDLCAVNLLMVMWMKAADVSARRNLVPSVLMMKFLMFYVPLRHRLDLASVMGVLWMRRRPLHLDLVVVVAGRVEATR